MNWILTWMLPVLLLYAPSTQSTSQPQPDWVLEIMEKAPRFTTITQCEWEGRRLWKLNACTHCHDMITQVYDAEKNLICQYGGIGKNNTCLDKGIHWEECGVIYGKPYLMDMGW